MIHDPLNYELLVARIDDLQRSRRQRPHPATDRPRRGPGRLRRIGAAALLRAAERLAKQPVDSLRPRGVNARSAGAVRRPAAG